MSFKKFCAWWKNFFRTEKKTAEIVIHLFDLFNSQGLNLLYDMKQMKVIAYDSSFFDMEEIRKEIAKNHRWGFFGEKFPEFYLQGLE